MVQLEGWTGVQNGELFSRTDGRFDVLILADYNSRYQQKQDSCHISDNHALRYWSGKSTGIIFSASSNRAIEVNATSASRNEIDLNRGSLS